MAAKKELGLRERSVFYSHLEKVHVLGVVDAAASLRDAAARLELAPSTLSEKLTALEGVFGRSLVERGGARLSLTPFARELVAAATGPLNALAELAPGAPRRALGRVVRLGAYDSLAVHLLPSLLEGMPAMPDMKRLEVRTGRSSVLMSSLARGELDFVVAIGGDESAQVESYRVGEDELCFAAPTKSPEKAAALLGEGKWIGLASGKGASRFYRTFLLHAGVTSEPVVACDSFEVVRSLAHSSGLPALLPRRVALRSPSPLCEAPVSDRARAASRHDIVLARRSSFTNPIFDVLLTRLRDALQKR